MASSEPKGPIPDSHRLSHHGHRHALLQPLPQIVQNRSTPTQQPVGTFSPGDRHGGWNSSYQSGTTAAAVTAATATTKSQLASLPSLDQLNLPPLRSVSVTAWHALRGHDSNNNVDGAAYDVPGSSDSEGAQTDHAGGGATGSGGGRDMGSQSPKRKAQNRVAQRALRKRRAARVNDLEVELARQQEVHRKGDEEMAEQISELELELASYQSKCRLLEEMLDLERTERLRAEVEVQSLKRPRTRDKDASPSA